MACLRDQFSNGVMLGGRYQTIAPLNHGSFGMVFTARDLTNGETVAIKVLTKQGVACDSGIDLVVDEKSEEFALHSRLGHHNNIVNLLHSFETQAHIFLVLEFCPRGDLYEAIRNGQGPRETEHVRRFMLELIDAVRYMHSKGVYHRDIKPENIFLTSTGSMKLGDFGLATTDKWSMESTVGSDRYMSPEQYDSAGQGYSPAQADIWAIGVVLLNILFSRNPFTTPTDVDPLFLDFSRDKQSLFDVFPSMSADTYAVISECMHLDPEKRSLLAAREALVNVNSFIDDEPETDEFCNAESRLVTTAYREPLRTPSIQSPYVDQGAFPWAKVMEPSPRIPIRKLNPIPDSYEEELFPKSEQTVNSDWLSGSAKSPSVTSTVGSSLKSLAMPTPRRPTAKMLAGSLPIAMNKPKNLSAMSFAFGGRGEGGVSKSWSDLWDEDEEEASEEQHKRDLQTRKEFNSRTWSNDSNAATILVDKPVPTSAFPPKNHMEEAVSTGLSHDLMTSDADADLGADGFFFHDPIDNDEPVGDKHHIKSTTVPVPHRYSPPKANILDRWAALGERRRAVGAGKEVPKPAMGSVLTHERARTPKTKRQYGFGNSYAPAPMVTGGAGGYISMQGSTWDHHSHGQKWNKEKAKDCPWNKGRDWNNYWRREKRIDHLGGDVEWVGAWQEAQS